MKHLTLLSEEIKKLEGQLPKDTEILIKAQVDVVQLPPNTYFCDTCFQPDPKMKRASYDPSENPFYTSCCHSSTISKLDVIEKLDNKRIDLQSVWATLVN